MLQVLVVNFKSKWEVGNPSIVVQSNADVGICTAEM
tara:strand:- start:627 stop:734 length:108 start_codon:yes stop_codon:yes gene_type:complete